MHPGPATTADEGDNQGRRAPEGLAAVEPLSTYPLAERHRVKDFACRNSARVTGFFTHEGKKLIPHYCRAFVLQDPDDDTHIWGYYTLSAALLVKETLSGGDEKRAARDFLGIPVPMVRIGFMGRDDTAPKGLGSALIIDAARRVYTNGDIAAWGLVLESEGGPENAKLWRWYQARGFKQCRKQSGSMYGPLSAFIPELSAAIA